jgi:hypothetical protein
MREFEVEDMGLVMITWSVVRRRRGGEERRRRQEVDEAGGGGAQARERTAELQKHEKDEYCRANKRL